MTTPIPWLERVPTYKEQIQELSEKDLSTLGFLGYPLLQTADIIIYNARYVPVGADQVAHLELSREIVRRFQQLLWRALRRAGAEVDEDFDRLPGLDNRKMSKSYGNTINLSDDEETVRKKVMSDVHGPEAGPGGRAGHGGRQSRFHISSTHSIPNVARGRGPQDTISRRQGGRRRGEEKARGALNAHLDPIRARREDLLAKPDALREILHEGSRKARAIAQETMSRVRCAVKLDYR